MRNKNLLLSFVISLLLVSLVSATWNTTLNDKLYDYYNFDEGTGTTVHSQINSSYDLTVPNVWSSGVVNNSLAFDGSVDNVILPFNQLEINVSGDISSCFWFYRSGDFSDYAGIMTDSGNGNSWGIFGNLNYMAFSAGDGSKTSLLTLEYQWYFICASWDKTNTQINVYINGELNFSGSSAFSYSGDDIELFNLNSGSSLNGVKIDELSFYGKVISLDDVQQLYNGGEGTTYQGVEEGGTGAIGLTSILLSPDDDEVFIDINGSNPIYFLGTQEIENASILNETIIIWQNGIRYDYLELTLEDSELLAWIVGDVFYNQLNYTGELFGNFTWNMYGCANNSSTTVCEWYSPTNRSFTVLNSSQIVVPEQIQAQDNSIRDTLTASGVGFGSFLTMITVPLVDLIIILTIVGGIVFIIITIGKAIEHFIKEKRR